jgi:glucose/arabinose dehydrogenase
MTAPRQLAALCAAVLLAAGPAAAGPARRPLDQAALKRAVAAQRPAFAACVTKAANKAPRRVDGTRAILRLTVLPSGRVGATALEPGWLESQSLGRCIMGAGRRLVVAPFAGAPVDLDVPLKLTVAR